MALQCRKIRSPSVVQSNFISNFICRNQIWRPPNSMKLAQNKSYLDLSLTLIPRTSDLCTGLAYVLIVRKYIDVD